MLISATNLGYSTFERTGKLLRLRGQLQKGLPVFLYDR